MKKRLFLFTALIVLAGLVVFFGATVYITSRNNMNIAKDKVIETTKICANLYNDMVTFNTFVHSGHETRITLIAADGSVLADSRPIDLRTADNHLDRPEVIAALNDAPETFVRYSDSTGNNYIYYALKVWNDDSYIFVRTAVPVTKTDAYLLQSLPLLLLALVVVLVMSFYLIRNTTNGILKPFNSVQGKLMKLTKGDYEQSHVSEYNTVYDEVNHILLGIDSVAMLLQNSITDLSNEKAKSDYIISNIGDGLFAVDASQKISLINNSALDIFSVKADVIGKSLSYLSADKAIAGAVRDSIEQGKSSLFEVYLFSKVYVVTVKNLSDLSLTMVILSDVTENRESAKRREEFFANASHELKTPLAAIKMFNDLTVANSKDESIKKYIAGISRETERMLSLITDMLKLSKLESTENINPVNVSVASVANEVGEMLSTIIADKELAFEVLGDTEVKAEYNHVYDVVKNLAENAVRYCNAGGNVTVIIEKSKITVSDDGIGIPSEEQTRIFERFYRVEKSRSQANGGTGLGLSIVKHICALYDWQLSLRSKFGSGTEVSVEFKKTHYSRV